MNNLIAKIAIITFLAFSQSLTAPAQGGRTAVSGEAKAPQATVVAAGDSSDTGQPRLMATRPGQWLPTIRSEWTTRLLPTQPWLLLRV